MEVKWLLANIRDREQTSKTLRKLSGRLFQMQDEEHRRIARETARLGRTGTRSGFYEPRRIAKADPRTGGIKEMTVGFGIAGMRGTPAASRRTAGDRVQRPWHYGAGHRAVATQRVVRQLAWKSRKPFETAKQQS